MGDLHHGYALGRIQSTVEQLLCASERLLCASERQLRAIEALTHRVGELQAGVSRLEARPISVSSGVPMKVKEVAQPLIFLALLALVLLGKMTGQDAISMWLKVLAP